MLPVDGRQLENVKGELLKLKKKEAADCQLWHNVAREEEQKKQTNKEIADWHQREATIKLGISQTALFNILKERQKISDEVKKNGNLSRKQKREGKSEEIETALLEWFKNARERKIVIARAILFQKAQDFSNILGDSDFKATDG
ncbi:hypothetical protein AVEN_227514-1 [Araneus ventricosus]|uniref:HTH CENPB-type domain-containing protein n=1 Tax=Araneus ventricosus TaxID=182803 RepID=A0A4Y2C3M1_ARAVE|nr:hypothetical protein AVEN_227514-1 [Araneus ventricosus]